MTSSIPGGKTMSIVVVDFADEDVCAGGDLTCVSGFSGGVLPAGGAVLALE